MGVTKLKLGVKEEGETEWISLNTKDLFRNESTWVNKKTNIFMNIQEYAGCQQKKRQPVLQYSEQLRH